MSGFKYVEDPILGKGRAEFIGGGTGGESYVAGEGIAINGNTISATGGGGEGTVTGIAASVSGGTATITATGSTTSVPIVGTGGVDVKGNTNTGAVELDAKDLSDGTQSITKDLKNARWIPSDAYEATAQNALTLLHFSDIHADTHTLARIMAEATALVPNINGMICTGDMVEKYAGDGYRDNVQNPDYVGVGSIADWWNPNVMTVIGNHDCADSSYNYTALSMANRDAYYIAPFESNWGITHTTGTSYYYKDYTTQNVRLIVLDIMLYGDNTTNADAVAQTNWLQGLLASAITAGLHVLIACHAAHTGSTHRRCSFSNFKQADLYTFGKANTPDVVINAVAAAITNGLHFCGYIVGHHHRDNVWDATGDGTQLIYCITTANVTEEHQYTLDVEQYRNSDYDAFNLLSIDTKHTTLKLLRAGGANIDCRMRPRQFISVNYSTGVITDYEIARGVTPEAAGFGMEVDIDRIARKRYDAVRIPNGSTVTLQAGYGYQFTASSEITLETEVQPSDSVGLESLLDITLSGGTVAAGENVILADTLTAGGRNICSVRYIDGIAVVKVLTVIGSIPVDAYAVSIATGTSDGSLYYGLATSDKSDIYVSSTLDGQTLDMGGAVTNGAKVVHGNGHVNTIVSGGVSCTSSTSFENMSMIGVSVLGGTMTMTNVNIPSNGNVSITGTAKVVPKNVFGAGVIDLTSATENGAIVLSSETVISGCSIANGAGITPFAYANSTLANPFISCIFSGGTCPQYIKLGSDPAFPSDLTEISLSGCTFTNINAVGGDSYSGKIIWAYADGKATLTDCTFVGNSSTNTVNFNAENATVSPIPKSYVTGCVVSGNSTSDVPFVATFSKTVVVSSSIISGNTNTYNLDVAVTQMGVMDNLGGNILGRIRIIRGGSMTFAGSNSVEYLENTNSTAYVTISSGASITLTSKMSVVSGAITVLTGGCVVNGANIPAGTYTQIVSSGGSAVAS